MYLFKQAFTGVAIPNDTLRVGADIRVIDRDKLTLFCAASQRMQRMGLMPVTCDGVEIMSIVSSDGMASDQDLALVRLVIGNASPLADYGIHQTVKIMISCKPDVTGGVMTSVLDDSIHVEITASVPFPEILLAGRIRDRADQRTQSTSVACDQTVEHELLLALIGHYGGQDCGFHIESMSNITHTPITDSMMMAAIRFDPRPKHDLDEPMPCF